MNNPWEGYLSGSYVPDTEEDFSTWGSPPKVYFPFSVTFSEDEGESDVVEEIEIPCSPIGNVASPKSRFSLFRRPPSLKYRQMISTPTVEPLISYPDDSSLICEENWDDVVRYCGPEAPVWKVPFSPAMLSFLNCLLPFPEYWVRSSNLIPTFGIFAVWSLIFELFPVYVIWYRLCVASDF